MKCLALTNRIAAAVAIGIVVVASTGHAAEPTASAEDSQTTWSPKFYGFCVDTHDAKKRTLPQQADMLCELGFDGVGYALWLDESSEKNLATLDNAGLELYHAYARISLKPDTPPYDPRVPEAIRRLKGRPVTICVLIQGLPPADPRGVEPAVKVLRELGNVATEAGLRISIYHHTRDWTESLLYALDVVKKVDRPNVGVNFNLCHWLMIDGDNDYQPVLRENADKIFAVTINGAQLGSKSWTNGLIQPLDKGDFDNRELLKTLREIGYGGPIGLMCYGIPGDAREHLERSMKVWKSWQEKWKAQR